MCGGVSSTQKQQKCLKTACPNSACIIFVTFPTIPIDPPKLNGEGEEGKLEFEFEGTDEVDGSCLLDDGTCGDEKGGGEA